MEKKSETGKKFLSVVFFMACIVGLLSSQSNGQTTLSHGHQVLLDRGMQFTALMITPDIVNTSAWLQSGFTSVDVEKGVYHWATCAGLPREVPFKLWNYDVNALVRESSVPYLMGVQLGDEQSIAASALPAIAADVATLKSHYPNAMIYTNNKIGSSGFQVSEFSLSTLMNYSQTVKPDMLHWTEYPFRWQGTGYSAQDYEGGSPQSMYVHMEMYRKAGLAGWDGTGKNPIPVGMYVQTYAHDSLNNRQPTESEFRLQQFAGLAFGMKAFETYIYEQNTDYQQFNDLFFDYHGVGEMPIPTAAFYQYADMLGEAKNLGKALINLVSTDVRMKMGQRESGATNPLPSDSFSQVSVGAWSSTADDHLKNVSATNLGSKNNGKEGDVVVGFFKALAPSLVEEGSEDDTYFMIVNGLSDEAGDSASCRQEIRLDFDFTGTEITQLLRLNRDTGEIENISLISDGGDLYHLDLILDGGTGDLFKYDTGTAFVPEPAAIGFLCLGGIAGLKRRRK